MPNTIAPLRSGWTTAALCFLVALLEGFDLQSVGVAAAGVKAQFQLAPNEMGWIFSAGLTGLLPGALFGGALADRAGRKSVLIGAVLLFGMASLLTAHAWNLPTLVLARFLTGLGIGAALPMIIALASEAAQAGSRSLAVSVTFCGMPLGGACAAAIGMLDTPLGWRSVFEIGGYAPVVVALLLLVLLPESRAFAQSRVAVRQAGRPGWRGVFAGGLWKSTVLLWVSSFFTLTVLYMLVNWLPSLLLQHGLNRHAVGLVQILFNAGGVFGAMAAGRMMDRAAAGLAVLACYAGILAGLAGLGLATQTSLLLAAGAIAGFSLMGAQAILYALAPTLYPTAIRATGVGMSVAVGRLGSVSGPLVAGKLVMAGAGIGGIVATVSPGVVIAAACAFTMLGWVALQRNGAPAEQGA